MFDATQDIFTRRKTIDTKQAIRAVFDIATDLKAIDPIIMDVSGCCSFTDYFFICSASSAQHLHALAEKIQRQLKKAGLKHYSDLESSGDSRWLLMDYGSFMAHLFLEEARHFYNLEQLWKKAPTLDPETGE